MKQRHLSRGRLVWVADAPAVARDDDDGMTGDGSHDRRPTDAERAFFETLVLLRGRYATRGDEDATSVMCVRHAIAAAKAAMAGDAPPRTHRLGIARN